jgi:hypothetical protein
MFHKTFRENSCMELLVMSIQERQRKAICEMLKQKRIRIKQAAEQCSICYDQMLRPNLTVRVTKGHFIYPTLSVVFFQNNLTDVTVRHESAPPLIAESSTGKALPSAFRI